MSASELKAIWADILPVELDLSIQSYLFSLTFAFPGSVRPIDNAWWLGGKPAPLPEIL
ncbi:MULTISPECIES: hypothetical protein [unclassified Bradyrhizobium]|uniref:hypothetical protein n=1 Tax=unclassified Bradyrhizobium TaxID=2631580 RepID=UPI001FF9FB7C|nr:MULTISPECIES: hypothetical protein [unclassified Bradyrhizobium]MCK1713130.1 hypothetical protein [Bradyrhizobium sp. 143]MCK1727402.1 hypothetical protein [Bradyrhizobium sp. 142]